MSTRNGPPKRLSRTLIISGSFKSTKLDIVEVQLCVSGSAEQPSLSNELHIETKRIRSISKRFFPLTEAIITMEATTKSFQLHYISVIGPLDSSFYNWYRLEW